MPLRNRSRNPQRRQLLKRHGKSKFSEGEVVLCYEPDPAKTKVLYSSKVMQIVEKYDDNDKRYEEYLIHFHGWNSTWDRYVTEDYILKDTPENRKLQQELANEAQLTPGGNLYKRDLRNRRRSSNSRRKSKNASEGMHDQNAQLSNGDAASQMETTHDEYSSDKSSDDEGMYISLKKLFPLSDIRIPAVLKKALGYDEYLIKNKRKLLKLPAEPSIITILEHFVQHYVTHGLHTCISKQIRRLKYEDLVSKVNLCKEVVDGLRIIFDYTIDNLLLYREEKAQFNDIHHIVLNPPVGGIIRSSDGYISEPEGCNVTRAPRVAEALPSTVETKANISIGKRVLRSQHSQLQQLNADQSEIDVSNQERPSEKLDKLECSVTGCKKEETLNTNSLPSSSCSSNGIAPPDNVLFDGNLIYNRHIRRLVQKEINDWKLIPDSMYSEKLLRPSLIYSATHLTRLFVKLPEILYYAPQRPEVIEVIVEYADVILSFLAEHLEWLGDEHYVSAEASRMDL